MTVNEHLPAFGGLRIHEYAKGGSLEGALRIPEIDRDHEEPVPSLGSVLEEVGDGAASIEGLVFGVWSIEMWETDSSELAADLQTHAAKLPGLRALFVGDIIGEECEISWIKQGPLGHLPGLFPKLEWFGVRGGDGLSLAGMKSESLRGLVVQTGGLEAQVVREVSAAALPALEHLELWLGTDEYGGSNEPSDLEAVFQGHFPKLRTLGLRNAEEADKWAAAVASAPLLETIEHLDMSMGALSDEGAEALLASPHFASLSTFNIAHHFVSDEVVAKLRGVLGDRLLGAGEKGEEDEYDGEIHRYIEVSE